MKFQVEIEFIAVTYAKHWGVTMPRRIWLTTFPKIILMLRLAALCSGDVHGSRTACAVTCGKNSDCKFFVYDVLNKSCGQTKVSKAENWQKSWTKTENSLGIVFSKFQRFRKPKVNLGVAALKEVFKRHKPCKYGSALYDAIKGKNRSRTVDKTIISESTKQVTRKPDTVQDRQQAYKDTPDTVQDKQQAYKGKADIVHDRQQVYSGKSDTVRSRRPIYSGKADTLQGIKRKYKGKADIVHDRQQVYSGKSDTVRSRRPIYSGKADTLQGIKRKYKGKADIVHDGQQVYSGKSDTVRSRRPIYSGKADTLQGIKRKYKGKADIVPGRKIYNDKADTVQGRQLIHKQPVYVGNADAATTG